MLKKLLALILTLVMIFMTSTVLIGCGENDPPPDEDNTDTPPESSDDIPNEPTGTVIPDKIVVVPPYKDYGRGTVNFEELSYARPAISELVSGINACTATIKENAISFEEQVAAIEAMEEGYNNALSMRSICEICYNKNTSDRFWAGEYAYITDAFPSFSKAVEDMMVAAAQSPNAERFESEYFGEGLVEEYKDGGVYTDDVVLLMEEEAALEAEFKSLSPATVEITYKGKTGTFSELVEELAKKYDKTSNDYISMYYTYEYLYEAAYGELAKDVMIEVFKVRAEITEAMGIDSYAEFAYESMGHDYSVKEMQDLLDDVCNYVYPTYVKLEGIFGNYLNTHADFNIDTVKLLNTLYSTYTDMDEDILDIYSYMLQHNLYSVDKATSGRFDGAFTTYIESNRSPYILMTSLGKGKDLLTLSHEFGHFIDGYVNYNSTASLDLAEVSSQSLELLTLLALEDDISESSYLYLMYYELEKVMSSLISQAFIALFEHNVYSLSSSQINEDSVEEAAVNALKKITGSNDITGYNISNLAITHTMLYPFYVQSYCTSMVPSLEIFIAEYNEKGAGLAIYKDLVSREDETMSFVESLTFAGLSNPFEKDLFKELMAAFYEIAVGCESYLSSDYGNVA